VIAVLTGLTPFCAACGDAVTDPLREAFDEDPAPILGAWYLADDTGRPDLEHPATIERGAGVLFGDFTFRLFGEEHRIQFADVPWDGETWTFTDAETFGLNLPRLEWKGTYRAPREFGGGLKYPAMIVYTGIRELDYIRADTKIPRCPEDCAPPGP